LRPTTSAGSAARGESQGPLTAWFEIAKRAQWADGHAVRADFRSAVFVGDDRVVFNIGGNKYRLIVRISYVYKQVLVKFVGPHAEHDKIDASTV
jgi:mRNA interferase HigB